jgi:hypothetical protein
LKRSKDELQ